MSTFEELQGDSKYSKFDETLDKHYAGDDVELTILYEICSNVKEIW